MYWAQRNKFADATWAIILELSDVGWGHKSIWSIKVLPQQVYYLGEEP